MAVMEVWRMKRRIFVWSPMRMGAADASFIDLRMVLGTSAAVAASTRLWATVRFREVAYPSE